MTILIASHPAARLQGPQRSVKDILTEKRHIRQNYSVSGLVISNPNPSMLRGGVSHLDESSLANVSASW